MKKSWVTYAAPNCPFLKVRSTAVWIGFCADWYAIDSSRNWNRTRNCDGRSMRYGDEDVSLQA